MRTARRLCAGACAALLAVTIGPVQAPAAERDKPNQALIAFSRFDPAQESFALFRARPDGSHRKRMTAFPAFFPDWAPDRSRLAFDFTDEEGNEQVGVVRRDGSRFRQLTDLPGISEVARFSPDGETLVFDRSPLFPDDPAFFTSLWVMGADGSHPRPLFDPDPAKFDVEPQFSPNGKRIVFARLRMVGSVQYSAVFVVGANGRGERRVTRFTNGLEHPRWSPDGRHIIFGVDILGAPTDPDGGIWRVRANGTGLEQLLPGDSPIFGFKPGYSPNGKRILFGCFINAQEQDDLCVMRADGSHVKNITRTPNIDENYPVWD